uniref:CAP-Gly domain-containing protein n=1 Tax=Panagrellus redivivus TaxID=6233 RepID=A0A7E4WAU3_PANRE
MAAIPLTIKKGSDFIYEKKFVDSTELLEFKQKLELITGVLSPSMKLELYDSEEKSFIKALEDDVQSLAALGVKPNNVIRVIELGGGGIKFDEDVPKYVISEDKYAQRENTGRKFREQVASNLSTPSSTESIEPFIAVGNRVIVRVKDQPVKKGTIQFVGEADFKPGVTWVGVNYDEPVGKNDGSVLGQRYFTAEPLHGGFVRPSACFPNTEIEEL